MASGDACIRDDGESPGVCKVQPQCTDDEVTAFNECMYCFPPDTSTDDGGDDGGCQTHATDAVAVTAWLLLLVWGVRQKVRSGRV
ncbi:MAG: hypothetical protein ACE366_31065 [Bradymonadia bacterium]